MYVPSVLMTIVPFEGPLTGVVFAVNGVLDGLSYKLIADRHSIAIDTVRMNVKRIYRKLEINSKSELFKMMGGRGK